MVNGVMQSHATQRWVMRKGCTDVRSQMCVPIHMHKLLHACTKPHARTCAPGLELQHHADEGDVG